MATRGKNPQRVADDELAEQAVRWLLRMRAPDVSPAEKSKFEEWLSKPDRRAAYERAQGTWQTLGTLDRTDVEQRRRVRRVAPYLGLLLLLASAGVALLYRTQSRQQREAMPDQIYATRNGEQRTVRLADGSRMVLDTNSMAHVRYSESLRAVELISGQCFFDVTHNLERPFEVTAAGGTTRVHGTTFNILIRDDRVTVTDITGAVAVARMAATRELHDGQSCYYDISATVTVSEVETIDADQARAWTDGLLVFKAQTLKSVLREWNRYHDQAIQIVDPVLEEMKVTGSFKFSDEQAFIVSIKALLNVDLVQKANGEQFFVRRPVDRPAEFINKSNK